MLRIIVNSILSAVAFSVLGLAPALAQQQINLTTQVRGILPVANGGTNAGSASGTAIDNISGFAATGFLTRTGAGAYAFQSTTNGVTLGNITQIGTNTVLGNSTAGTANVSALAVGGCSSASSALIWTTNTGFGCNTAIAASTVTNFTGTTSLTNNGGAGTLTWPLAGATLTIPTGGGTLGSAAFTASTAYLPISGGTLTGNLLFTDATYDIGASGATRPRDLFLSRNALFGGTLTTTGNVTLGNGVSPNITLGNSTPFGDNSFVLKMLSSTAVKNWEFSFNYYDEGYSFTPSTAAGGTTFAVGNRVLRLQSTGVVSMQLLATSSAATTGTMCWTTGTGAINVDTTTTCLLSSKKYKQAGRGLDIGLRQVMALRPVAYQLKPKYNPAHLGEQIGFFAEDVARVDERLVSKEDDGSPHSVRYQQLTALLTRAIQQQQREISKLSKRVLELERSRMIAQH